MSLNPFTGAAAISIVACIVVVPATVAGTTVYKCVKDGQIVRGGGNTVGFGRLKNRDFSRCAA